MRERLNVQFNPKETPLSEIERKLKFLDEIKIIINPENNAFEELKKGFDVTFNKKNSDFRHNVDIIPVGNVRVSYTNLEKIPMLENCVIGCDNNYFYIYDNTVNNPDSYHFFYRRERK